MNIPIRALGRSPGLIAFLDYDGTLVGLRKRPELARLSPRRRGVLKELGRTAVVTAVTGRSVAEARRLIGIPSLDCIGNHGFEIAHGDRTWIHPGAAESRAVLRSALRRIRARSADLDGVLIEDKGLTAGVHYRLLDPAHVGWLRSVVLKETGRERGLLKATFGKKVIEIRPNADWDKGRGVLEYIRWLGPEPGRKALYIGDDRTDEDAFRALRGRGTTIVVGRAEGSAAEFSVRGVNQVWALLGELVALRSSQIIRPMPRCR
ncbi:MAG: trehalose-phosphatase [Candidatus Aminicenantales bacterium]